MAAFKSLVALVALLLAVGAVDAHKPPKLAADRIPDSVASFLIANKNSGFGILLEAVLVIGAGQAPVHRQQTPVAVSTVLVPRGVSLVKVTDMIVGKNGAAVIQIVTHVLIPGNKFFN
ncbi:hypothetical protein C2E20_0547 isoform B [Micractinium conductrix]|uniref:Uncharacterized protein n=1 Tax=Micractinium conductrix TaxID=554055 RepID=A0A2P6VQ95_9CHLO|nr:hypothetical protein C2E20_0547 isoform B [Micractinium conductrix]|eukprot:PSC76237.1 hypothetical protein C2E20_0547 isoform B [Micractinium conductrix]